jgi:uncharacterized protein (DUF1501 family)
MLSRRHFLAASAASSVFYAGYPIKGFAQTRDLGKIAVVILEGGMDGLATVVPIGDPALVKQRKGLIASSPIALNPFFALHPALPAFANMLANNEAAIVHATSMPYVRRSHFEGQDVMQSGIMSPFSEKSGWLGRAMELAGIPGTALALDLPLLIRSAAEADTIYPSNIAGTDGADLAAATLLAERAAATADLHDAFGAIERRLTMQQLSRRRDVAGLALTAGKEMSRPGGPNVSVIRLTEFDTHSHQGTDDGRQPRLLATLDQVFDNYKKGLGDAWNNTIIMTLTEFGRTVQENGSEGTDHGYGTAGLLAGGLLKKSSVIANWPGLGNKDLFEGRDLMSTLDYRAVCAAAIEAAFGLPHDQISEQIFGERKLAHIHQLLFA